VFPISADRLSLAQLAEFWAPEINRPVTAPTVYRFLCQAWWRGEFRGVGPSRLDVLKQLRWGPLPDGDSDSWTEDDCAPAFAAIAASWPREPGTPLVFTAPMALAEIELSRAEFSAWVTDKGYDLPTFWGEFSVDAEIVSNPSGLKPTESTAAPPGAPHKRGCSKATGREPVTTKTRVLTETGQSPTTGQNTTIKRGRGRPAIKRGEVEQAMRAVYVDRYAELANRTQGFLCEEFNASRTTIRNARARIVR
jgi:hypothetical protein